MSDDRDRPRRPGGNSGPPRGRSGGKSFGSKPFKARSADDKPFRKREEGDRPSRGRDFSDRPPRRFDDRDGKRKPFHKREEGDRPRSRDFGDRSPRRFDDRDGARKPFRKRDDGDRPQFRPRPPREEGESAHAGERIAKAMARAGLCSRRDAEEWIAEGRVSVNGTVIDSPALNITAADKVLVDGEPMPEKERTRLWLYHKPAGLVTTASDPEGRPTVFQNLPEDLPRVMSIGRLDINTEGLLLLTNDGGLARVLALPETGWLRRYRVRAHGETDQAKLDALKQGIAVDGVDYEPIHATLDRVQGRNVWLTLDLREGKNREVKVVLEHLGLMVNRLIRVSFGPFQLGDIREGDAEEVRTRMLKDQLGDRLATEAEADFDGPRKTAPAARPERTEERPRFDRRPDRDDRGFEDRRGPKRFVGERGRDDEREAPRGRVLIDETDPYAPPPGERSRKPAERNVFRDDEAPQKPRHKRLDREEFGARRRAASLGEDPALKVERGETADRAGRRVGVERIRGPREEEPAERPQRRGFRDQRDGGGDRPPRRFDREDGDRPRRFSRDGDSRPPRSRDERPPRRFDRDDRPPHDGGGERSYRKPRFEDGEGRPPRERSFGDRPPRRFEGDERPPRRFDRDDGRERKPFAGKGGGSRDRSDGPRQGERSGGKSFGGKSFGGRPSGGKPFGGKPGGRGGRPPRSGRD
jgi:23S rRNA pseudouridine2605 synthase